MQPRTRTKLGLVLAVAIVPASTRDLLLAQRFARHASPLTTTVYTHSGDEQAQKAVAGLWC